MDSLHSWFTDTGPQAARVQLDPPAPRMAHSASDAFAGQLQRFVAATPGVRAVVVASSSGVELSSVLHQPLASEPLAAIASTLLGVGRGMLEQAAMGECLHVVIESRSGAIVVMSVGDARRDLLLAALVDSSAMLGQVLWAARRCCAQLRLAD